MPRNTSRRAQIRKNLGKGAFSKGPRYGGPEMGRPVGKLRQAEIKRAAPGRERTEVRRNQRGLSDVPRNPQIQQFGFGPVKKPKRRYL